MNGSGSALGTCSPRRVRGKFNMRQRKTHSGSLSERCSKWAVIELNAEKSVPVWQLIDEGLVDERELSRP